MCNMVASSERLLMKSITLKLLKIKFGNFQKECLNKIALLLNDGSGVNANESWKLSISPIIDHRVTKILNLTFDCCFERIFLQNFSY